MTNFPNTHPAGNPVAPAVGRQLDGHARDLARNLGVVASRVFLFRARTHIAAGRLDVIRHTIPLLVDAEVERAAGLIAADRRADFARHTMALAPFLETMAEIKAHAVTASSMTLAKVETAATEHAAARLKDVEAWHQRGLLTDSEAAARSQRWRAIRESQIEAADGDREVITSGFAVLIRTFMDQAVASFR